MAIKDNMLQHLIHLKAAAGKYGFTAHFDLTTYYAEVHMGMRSHTLYPQFIIFVDGQKFYTSDFTDDVIRFCGWRPYKTKIIKEFSNKIHVKKMLQEAGLATPEYSIDNNFELEGVIVKKAQSSFGFSIKGPFHKAEQIDLNREDEEYYEKFIDGTIVKSWFWNDKPICYEYQEMPSIIGDGVISIRQKLHSQIQSYNTRPSIDLIKDVVTYYRHDIDDILKRDEKLIVDFRYASKFGRKLELKDVNINENDVLNLHEQLRQAGEFAWQHVPDKVKNCLAYTVDAILDSKDKLWLLEINCNPMMHPYMYAPMIDYLHGITDTECLAQLPVR